MGILDVPQRSRARVFHDPAGKANGSASPLLDSGQTATPFTLSSTLGTPDAWVIRNGKLAFAAYDTTTPTSDAVNHAIYWPVDLGRPVTRIKAKATWPAASLGGTDIGIIVPSAPWSAGGGLPAAGIHFGGFGNGQWTCAKWNGSSLDAAYGSDATMGRYAPQNTGVEGTFEFFIDRTASTMTVFFPDGSYVILADAAIAAFTANTVVFELFVSAAVNDIPPVFGQIAADDQVLTFDNPTQTRLSVATQVAAGKRTSYEYNSSAGAINTGVSVPPGIKGAYFDIIAPGAGGGSGRRGAAGTVRCGGGSGGSGGVLRRVFVPAASLGSTINVNIPVGGAGGAAVTANDTSGNPGVSPGNAQVSSTPASGPQVILRALGGGLGAGGTATTGAAGTGGAPLGVTGQNASTTGLVGAAGSVSVAGGPGMSGSGGGITSADVASAGGAGSSSFLWGAATGGTGGVVDSTAPTGGTARQADRPGDGVGGGASSITTAAQAGADGVGYGAAGGGGGASLNGNNSGKGGVGGPGYVRIEFVYT